MQIDPIFVIASAVVVAVILASAATHKLRAPARFTQQLEDYQLLPQALLQLVARCLPLLEIGTAFALLVPASRPAASLLAAAMLAMYAAAISINLWRGRADIDCGCSGPDQTQPLRPALLTRNALLVSLALVASITPQARDFSFFEGFVVIAAAAVALLIYAAAEGLLANGPRLFKLIGR
jgi:hypothetical protein